MLVACEQDLLYDDAVNFARASRTAQLVEVCLGAEDQGRRALFEVFSATERGPNGSKRVEFARKSMRNARKS